MVYKTAWDARAYPTAGIVHAASVTHGGIYGSRYAAVITTGQAKPSCFIPVILFLPTSRSCYETPQRPYPGPAELWRSAARPLSPPRRLSLLVLADIGAARTLITPDVALELDLHITPCGRTLQRQSLYQGPARGALEA